MSDQFVLVLPHRRERLREALFARTWELAPLLEEIDSVTVDDRRRTEAGREVATHTWRAKANVPPLLAPHIDSDYFVWTATVEWGADDFTSRWRIEPHAVKESLACTLEATLAEAMGGRGTRVQAGLEIEGLDGRRGVETIAYQIVSMNLRKLVDAAARRLADG